MNDKDSEKPSILRALRDRIMGLKSILMNSGCRFNVNVSFGVNGELSIAFSMYLFPVHFVQHSAYTPIIVLRVH